MQTVLIALIRVYQKTLSLLIGSNCRFYPTCSSYAIEAIRTHGSLKGGWMAIKRISRCHPLNPGGIDPVPQAEKTCKASCDNKDPSFKHCN